MMKNKRNSNSALFSDLIIEVFRLNRKLLDAGDMLTNPVGLSSARWQVLGVVEHGPATIPNVAREIGLTRQGVLQTADILATEGYISYQENPHHRRAKLMVITPKGRDAMHEIKQRHSEWANLISSQFSLSELNHMLEELRKLHKIIDHTLSHNEGV